MNSKQYFLVRSNDRFDSYKRHLNTINNILLDTLYYLDEEEYCYFIDYEKNPDDTHRLFYVACTRTEKNLYIIEPQTKKAYNL